MILGFVLRGRVMKLGVKHMGESREESEKYEASKNNTWLALSIFMLILAHTHDHEFEREQGEANGRELLKKSRRK